MGLDEQLARLTERVAALERYFDAYTTGQADMNASLRNDVHKSVSWVGIEFYDLKPQIAQIVDMLSKVDRRTEHLEDRAAHEDEERPARQILIDANLDTKLDVLDQRTRWLIWGLIVLAVIMLVVVVILAVIAQAVFRR